MAITKVINDLIDLNATDATKSLKMPKGAAYSGTADPGMVRNSSETGSQGSANVMQHFNGTDWKNYENVAAPVVTVDFLVVAGGAGGGGFNNAGGGGAGGLRTSYGSTSGGGQSSETSLSLSLATPYDVEVGPGGAGGTNSGSGTSGVAGTNSEFNGIISSGGGSGGKYDATGGVGGSGGGGGYSNQAGGAAVTSPAIQGYAGQAGVSAAPGYIGGGAGGAGETGGTDGQGHGGDGLQVNIDGLNNFYAGGGSGGANNQSIPGSSGGGGNGGYVDNTNPGNGTLNTGGGGGGASGGSANTGGNGGLGTVILRYPTVSVGTPGYTVTGTLDTVADTAYPIANLVYYKLEGGSGTTVTDSSGNGNDGVSSNLDPYAPGRFGNAAVFNGTSSRILTGLTLPADSTMSFSFWINSNTPVSNDYIISDRNSAGLEHRLDIGISSSAIFVIVSNGSSLAVVSFNTITYGEWMNFVVVLNGTSITVYKNGISLGTQTSTVAFGTAATQPLYMGRLGNFNNFYFNGSIDQVRIFSSALSAGNATSLYNEGTVIPSTDGTDSILQFIGGTGTVTFS